MFSHAFGATGLTVSALGFGAGQIGGLDLDEGAAGALLNAALDLGITFVDTARGYGASEDRIGRHLSHRRDGFVLATKGGYGVDGVEDWTPACITQGVDAALRRLRTDRIDVFFLHSCPREVLQRPGLIEALEAAVQAGKVRVPGYSGENEDLAWAVESGRFGAIECSVNLFDQASLGGPVAEAARRGLGVVAKRPLGNAPWRFTDRPAGDYGEAYWERMQAMNLGPLALGLGAGRPADGLGWDALALRFAAFAPGVSTAIAGTGRAENLRRNAAIIADGPLPPATEAAVRAAFAAHGAGWRGEV